MARRPMQIRAVMISIQHRRSREGGNPEVAYIRLALAGDSEPAALRDARSVFPFATRLLPDSDSDSDSDRGITVGSVVALVLWGR